VMSWRARVFTSAARVLRPTALRTATGLTVAWHMQQRLSSSGCDGVASYLKPTFIADAAAVASPALVNISVGSRGGLGAMKMSSGSGFIVESSGLIVTNNHVVENAVTSGQIVVTLSDGVTRLRASVQHIDKHTDIAILRVQHDAPLPTVTLGTSANLRPGEFVVALGAPAGLSNSVSAGIISAVHRTRSEIGLRDRWGAPNHTEYLQTDAAINQGNSGGPLLNLQGQVIGVNTMKLMGMDNLAFAVPIDDVKQVISQLQTHGRVLRPYLGLKFMELDRPTADDLRRRGHSVPDNGLHVVHVAPGSPAQRGGVRVNDTVVGVDRTPIRNKSELLEALNGKVGANVKLNLQREGAGSAASVTVESLQQ